MLVARMKIQVQCPWVRELAKNGVNVNVLQCIPQQNGPGSSSLCLVTSESLKSEELRAVVKNTPSVEKAVFKETLRDSTYIGIVKTRRCACAVTGIPFKHLIKVNPSTEFLNFTALFEDGEEFKRFIDELENKHITMVVEEVSHSASDIPLPVLTAKQEKLLKTALKVGFYDTPRKTKMAELARAFGTSPRAVSEMLRRAHKKIAESLLNT
ncbi:MAG: helix-turn-helix domain-containing protein [Candidatus Caldarchaeum sp.]